MIRGCVTPLSEISSDPWGPFAHVPFRNPDTRVLSRVGVIDVGSNSVRMVMFDGAARAPTYFFNEKVMCGLGAGLADTGVLNPKGRRRALAALHRFQTLAQGMDAPPLTAVATAAVRDARDGPDFVAEVLEKTGMQIHVINGHEEARLSAQGVLLGWPGSYGLVCDIGGLSMELAEISGGAVGKRLTSSLGPLKLKTIDGGRKERRAHIRTVMHDLREQMGDQRDRLFLVGGSWRAIARIDMERRKYPMHVLHEYRMSVEDVLATAKYIDHSALDALRSACGISFSRMALVPLATEVLTRLVREFEPKDIAISSYGIREGLLYEQMPQALRDRDPLIEACHFAEAKDARLPGFGAMLNSFVAPLFPDAAPALRRLIKAACLLHDVSWRAHPDYRAEVCFDYATRANLGGLKHSERVFLGLALLHRYKKKSGGTRFAPLFDMLSDADQKEAEILGKAMRFGAMLWMRQDAQMARLDWNPVEHALVLHLTPEAEPLYGEIADARFKSLVAALKASGTVRIVPGTPEPQDVAI
ncbi:MAG: Ppx/GppA family phosphatase [Rhodobacteraceae bacterium]|nr:Ppx/GppA family phosphatase [Paracoccaceae bacterium]